MLAGHIIIYILLYYYCLVLPQKYTFVSIRLHLFSAVITQLINIEDLDIALVIENVPVLYYQCFFLITPLLPYYYRAVTESAAKIIISQSQKCCSHTRS